MKKVLLYLYTHPLALFTLIGFFVYANILFNNFVWLDYSYIIANPQLQTVNIANLFRGSALTATGYYRPVSAVFLGVQWGFFYTQPFWYHLFQILLRITTVYFLFKVFSHFFSKKVSLFLSLIYLVHPMNESQVAYIASVADMLFICFGLMSLHISLGEKAEWFHLIIAKVLLLGSLFSKESGVLFFLVTTIAQLRFSIKRFVMYAIGGVAVVGIYFLTRLNLSSFSIPDTELYPFHELSILQRIINVPKILSFYISKFFIPYDIGGLHMWTVKEITFPSFYQPLIIDIAFFMVLAVIGFYIYTKRPKRIFTYLFFLSFCILGMSVNVQIVPLDYTVSSRWFAFSMIGLLGIAGTFIDRQSYPEQTKKMIAVVGCMILVYLSVLTVIRNNYWKDNISLFSRWAMIDDNFAIENLLANSYFLEEKYIQAKAHAEKSVSMLIYDSNLSLLAQIHEKLGDVPKALDYARATVKQENYARGGHSIPIYSEVVQLFMRNNEFSDALTVLKSAVVEYPDQPYFWTMMAVANEKLNNIEESKANYQKVQELLMPVKN